MFSPKTENKARMPAFTTPIYHCTMDPSYYKKARKTKSIQIEKEKEISLYLYSRICSTQKNPEDTSFKKKNTNTYF